MVTLRIEHDGRPPAEVRVDRFPCRIGRDAGCDVVLSHWRVGRFHAEIHRFDDGLRVIDAGAFGGTTVNGERIGEFGPLAEFDELRIAGFRLRLMLASGGDAGSARDRTERSPGEPATAPAVRSDAGHTFDRRSGAGASPIGSATPPEPDPARPTAAGGGSSVPGGDPTGMTGRASGQASGRVTVHLPESLDGPTDGIPSDAGASDEALALEWQRRLHRGLIEVIDLRRRDVRQLSDEQLRAEVGAVLDDMLAGAYRPPEGIDPRALARRVLDEAIGLGPLEPLLADPSITEIMVNAADSIWVEREGRLHRHPGRFTDDAAIRAVIERIVAPLGRRIDDGSPMVDARLADGSRVNAVIPPLAVHGPALTIRRFSRRALAPDDLVRLGSASRPMVEFLRVCVEARRNIVVSGGTGSGKTTLLNVLSNLIPVGERLITIEDAAELRLAHPHLVALEARPANLEGRGAVTIRDLVRNALRMRPDRVIVGECRGGEALDMLQAMNTGHEGSLTTVHANSPRDALARLEVMVMMGDLDLPIAAVREQIAAAVDVVVHQARAADGSRRISGIVEVTGIESGRLQTQELFRFAPTGWDESRRLVGGFEGCDAVPQFYETLAETGWSLDYGLFRRGAAAGAVGADASAREPSDGGSRR